MIHKPLLIILWFVFLYGEAMAETIKVPDVNTLQLVLHGKGDQIFTCVKEGHAYTWLWQAPEAKLYDEHEAEVGSHGAGPTWTHKDGSSVTAKLLQKVAAPDKTAAPWLLLESTGNKGKGVFSDTAHILRINTQGGIAPPAEECDDKHVGSEKRMAYSADYNFYRK